MGAVDPCESARVLAMAIVAAVAVAAVSGDRSLQQTQVEIACDETDDPEILEICKEAEEQFEEDGVEFQKGKTIVIVSLDGDSPPSNNNNEDPSVSIDAPPPPYESAPSVPTLLYPRGPPRTQTPEAPGTPPSLAPPSLQPPSPPIQPPPSPPPQEAAEGDETEELLEQYRNAGFNVPTVVNIPGVGLVTIDPPEVPAPPTEDPQEPPPLPEPLPDSPTPGPFAGAPNSGPALEAPDGEQVPEAPNSGPVPEAPSSEQVPEAPFSEPVPEVQNPEPGPGVQEPAEPPVAQPASPPTPAPAPEPSAPPPSPSTKKDKTKQKKNKKKKAKKAKQALEAAQQDEGEASLEDGVIEDDDVSQGDAVAGGGGCSPLSDVVVQHSHLAAFSIALTNTGLYDVIDQLDENVTVLAPTDVAFEELANARSTTLLDLVQDVDYMNEVLRLHIVKEQVSYTDLTNSMTLATLLPGASLLISTTKSDYLVVSPGGRPATIQLANIISCKATMHQIDRVLLPADVLRMELVT